MITLGGFVMSVTFDTIQLFDQSLDNDDRQLEVSILLFQTFFFFFFHFCGQNGCQDKITYYVTDDIFWNFVMNPWKE